MNKTERFIKLMQLTQSSNDNEALAALRKANELLAAENTDWRGLITKLAQPRVVRPVMPQQFDPFAPFAERRWSFPFQQQARQSNRKT